MVPSRRLLVAAAAVAAVVFAVQGGEYSTTDLFRQRARERSLRSAIDSLQRDLDSLKTFLRQLREDPMTQERVARERYGMVRGDKEIVYRFTDSAAGKP